MLPVGDPVLTVSDQVTIFVMGQVEVPTGVRGHEDVGYEERGQNEDFRKFPIRAALETLWLL